MCIGRMSVLACIFTFLYSAIIIRGDSIDILDKCGDDANYVWDRSKIFYNVPQSIYDVYGPISLYATNSDCFKCSKTLMANGSLAVGDDMYQCASVYTPFAWKLFAVANDGTVLARAKYTFGERGHYGISTVENEVSAAAGGAGISLHIEQTEKPVDSLEALYILGSILIVIVVVAFSYESLWEYIQKLRGQNDNSTTNSNTSYSYAGLGQENGSSEFINGSISNQPLLESLDDKKTNPTPTVGTGTDTPLPPTAHKKPARVISLDTFRGISLCLMIFVNYGGGGYWFFDHAAWNGFTLADTVFPWFMWMMGVSMALSFSSLLPRSGDSSGNSSGSANNEQLQQQAKSKSSSQIDSKVWYHVCRRSLILFLLGMFLANGYEYSTWRIPGVLQYFAVSYFVTAVTVLTMFPYTQRRLKNIHDDNEEKKVADKWLQENAVLSSQRNSVAAEDGSESSSVSAWCWSLVPSASAAHMLTGYSYEWIIQLTLMAVYLIISYGVAAPGCPVGYIGPGGISEHSEYKHCTGGIHRFIDWKVFTDQLLFHHPTCLEMYDCIPYDPEGLLGVLSACNLTYLGLMAGRVLLHFKEHKERLFYWYSASFVLMLLAGILCGFSRDGGLMPVNKNLWSTSFVLLTAGLGLVGLAFCYILVDVYKVWSGAPFLYMGMNSILIYCAHGVFQGYMPFEYKIYVFDHPHELQRNVLGTFCWVVIAYYFYKIKFFVKI